MPEYAREMFYAWCIGATIGLGQMLAGDACLTLRLAIGRAICSGFLGAVALAAPLVWPDISPSALGGLVCALASGGTSAIEALVERIGNRK